MGTLRSFIDFHKLQDVMRHFAPKTTKNISEMLASLFNETRPNTLKHLQAYSAHVKAPKSSIEGDMVDAVQWMYIWTFIFLCFVYSVLAYDSFMESRYENVVFLLILDLFFASIATLEFKIKNLIKHLNVTIQFPGYSHERNSHFYTALSIIFSMPASIIFSMPASVSNFKAIYFFRKESEIFVMEEINFLAQTLILKYFSPKRTVAKAEYSITRTATGPNFTLTRVSISGNHYNIFNDIPGFQNPFSVQMLITKK